MAGTDSRFDAAAFRTAIKFAMRMGLPNAIPDRATFRWSPQRTFAIEDPAHNPYDWGDAPATEVTHVDVRVDVAVEMLGGAAEETSVGQINNQKAQITILDEDYTLVEGADIVLLGTNTYQVDFVSPPLGLFEVTVYTLSITAVDEA